MLKIRTWYNLHKWTSIFAGLALVMWLITGITMTWESLFLADEYKHATVDYREETIAPSETVTAIAAIKGKPVTVVQVDLKQMLDSLVYQVTLADGEVLLIDARSRKQLVLDENLAQQVASQEYRTREVSPAELLLDHSVDYPYGPLPAYRMVLLRNTGTQIYVDARTGEIWSKTRWDRIRDLLNSLHTFDSLRIVIKQHRVIIGLLVLAGMVVAATALMGYYLALPRRWQFLSRRQKDG